MRTGHRSASVLLLLTTPILWFLVAFQDPNSPGLRKEALRLTAEGESAQALSAYESLRLQCRADPDSCELRPSDYYNMGLLSSRLDHRSAALDHYRLALDLAMEEGDTKLSRSCLNNMALLRLRHGQTLRAKELFLRALALFEDGDDREQQARIITNLGTLETELGLYDDALGAYDRSLRIAESTGDEPRQIINTLHIANTLWITGDLGEADSCYERVIGLSLSSGDRKGLADGLTGKALVKKSFDLNEEALPLIYQALALHTETGDLVGQSIDLNDLCLLHLEMGDTREAASSCFEALEIAQGLGPKIEGMILSNLGLLHIETGHPGDAVPFLQEGLEIHRSANYRPGIILGYLRLAQAFYDLGRLVEAGDYCRQCSQALEGISLPALAWQLHFIDGRIKEAVGLLGEALEAYTRSSEVIESTDMRIESSSEATAVALDVEEVYKALVSLLMRMNVTHPEAGYDIQALEVLERGRGIKIIRAFADLEILFARGRRGDLYVHARNLSRRAMFIEVALKRALEAPKENQDPAVLAYLDKGVRDIKTEYADFLETIEKQDPVLASHLRTTPLSTKALQRQMQPDMAILEYFVNGPKVIIFTITRTMLKAETITVDPGVFQEALRVVGGLIRHRGGLSEDERILFSRHASYLYDVLIGPVATSIEDKELIGIVPDRSLHYIPFQCLIDRDEKGRDRYLIEKACIFYLHNLLSSRFHIERQGPGAGEEDMVIFGNPGGSLAGTEEEGTFLKSLFPNAEIYLGEEATEKNAKRALSEHTLCHIGSHALLDETHPEMSHILFAPGEGDDGRLTIAEIYGLALQRSPFMTLAACQTATSLKGDGDELVSLSDAFLSAGARSIVASLWRVDDEATKGLMKSFYRNLLEVPAARALRLAQIEVMQSRTSATRSPAPALRDIVDAPPGPQTRPGSRPETFNDPFFWAPFILIGDWQ
ncbi:CHAT domain-containing protein [Thermodesulfobacteriota bacterium]